MSHEPCASITVSSPSDEWAKVVQRFNQTGKHLARDICQVLGDPVGGVLVSPAPDKETAYRTAGYGV